MVSFEYQNPTKILFGQGSVSKLGGEILKYGRRVLLVYGGKSTKESGIYDRITGQLSDSQITYFELGGVTAPRLDTLYRGIEIARGNQADIVVGIGGGCCIDMAKAVALGTPNKDIDVWDVLTRKIPWTRCDVLPIGAVVTIAGSGSEMDGNSEIDHPETGEHGSIGSYVKTYPAFSILDPDMTEHAPFMLTAYHGVCIMIQALEQYFCGTPDTPIQDGFIETICRTVISSLETLQRGGNCQNSREQLLWASALVTNRILGRGKEAPWMAGPLNNILKKKTGISYTEGIAVTFPKYLQVCYKDNLALAARFAVHVMDVDPEGRTEEETAKEGADRFQKFFDDLGLAHSLKDLGKEFGSYMDFEEEIDACAKKGQITKKDLQEIIRLSIG